MSPATFLNDPTNRGPFEGYTHEGKCGEPGNGPFVQMWLAIGVAAPPSSRKRRSRPGHSTQDKELGAQRLQDSRLNTQDSGAVIVRANYSTHGCMWSIACAGACARLATGRTIEQALLIEGRDLDLLLGGIPEGKGECAEMAVRALRQALGAP